MHGGMASWQTNDAQSDVHFVPVDCDSPIIKLLVLLVFE